ncbi:hypothetical protein L596_017596 [Steinernema carpocapsae]|uniref:DNA topoisomerase (ATP-hydrolyzing) n=1 Tax=Steinernema carpocapsae TaxID=34508 RepID=A0A4U5N260_STECR|nr:hypothetical protein L596_017596 [Steinernema carpocapsae]
MVNLVYLNSSYVLVLRYCPIIPTVLVNGAEGIGTGWSTKVPNFNPREIVENMRRLIRGEEPKEMVPWYKNFRGTITRSRRPAVRVQRRGRRDQQRHD